MKMDQFALFLEDRLSFLLLLSSSSLSFSKIKPKRKDDESHKQVNLSIYHFAFTSLNCAAFFFSSTFLYPPVLTFDLCRYQSTAVASLAHSRLVSHSFEDLTNYLNGHHIIISLSLTKTPVALPFWVARLTHNVLQSPPKPSLSLDKQHKFDKCQSQCV